MSENMSMKINFFGNILAEDIDYSAEKLFMVLKKIVEFPDHIVMLLAQFSGKIFVD